MRSSTWLACLLLSLVLGGALPLPVLAGDEVTGSEEDRIAREVRLVERRIVEMKKEAERLRAEGHADEAREVVARAEEMARRLAQFRDKRASERARDGKQGAMDAQRRQAILRGLGQGIEALSALGRKEDAAHLREIAADLKRRGPEGGKHAQADKRRHHAELEHLLELLGLAKRTLVAAGRHEHAHVVEHGMHAVELEIAGRRDEEARKVRETAPPRARQGEALLVAAELLQDQGDARHAKMLAKLGKAWHRHAKAEQGERPGWMREGRAGLPGRLEIMGIALKALREGERKGAAEIVERALRAAKVMLAEREDEEAAEILAQAPRLGELAEVLHLASDLWMKFGHEKRAHLVAQLAHFYTEHAQAQRRRENALREGPAQAPGEDLEHMRRELQELRQALERMQRRLEEMVRGR